MHDRIEMNTSQHVLQKRVEELERENRRLSGELKEALQTSEGRFRSLVETAFEGIWTVDTNGRTTFVNRRMAEMLKYDSPDDLLDRSAFEFIPPENIAEARAKFRERLSTDRPEQYIVRLRCRDGSMIWASTASNNVFDEQGQVIGRMELFTDITEYKRAEDALRQSEEKFARAFQSNPAGMAITRAANGQYIDVNESLCQIVGYTPEEILGRTSMELGVFTRTEREEVLRQFQKQGRIRNQEFKITTKDGMARWVLFSLDSIAVADESCFLTTMIDITDRKKAEEDLAETEQQQRELARLLEVDQARLAEVIQQLPVGVWIADQNGRLVGTNKRAHLTWEEMSRLLNSPFEYQTYLAWHAESGKRIQPEEYPIAVTLRTGQPAGPMELKIRHLDGSLGTALVSAAPIKDHNGILIGAVGVNVDITERKRLEEALRESEYRFRVMADGTPVILWVTDTNGEMEFINQAYTDFFGVTLEQIQSGSWQTLVHPDDQSSYVDTYLACLRDQRPFRAEARVLRKDGEWRWVISQGQPRFAENGEFLGMAGSSLDVTQRRQAEQTVLEAQIQIELQHRLIRQREQERLSIAQEIHDGPIQTLAAIIMDLGITRDQFSDPAFHAELDKTDLNIRSAVQELRRVVSELRPPLLQFAGFSQAMRGYADDFRNRHSEIELTQTIAEDQDRLSEEVSLCLFRVYQEALNNIVRHSGATQANVRFSFVEDMAVLAIEDNGRGMEVTPDLIQQTTKGHYGMAGMKERVDAVGGELQVVSTVGKGTTILVKVPVSRS